jgi:hypothetical protein
MEFSVSNLAAGFIYGVMGAYLIKRAKREVHFPRLFIGMFLIAYPYFIENAILVWGLGAAALFVAFRMD